jgi:hypothetical protein
MKKAIACWSDFMIQHCKKLNNQDHFPLYGIKILAIDLSPTLVHFINRIMKGLLIGIMLISVTITCRAQTQDPWIIDNTPSEIHNMLGRYNGDFVLDITMWMENEKEPKTYNIVAVNRMILEGRFLEIAQSGNIGDVVYKALTTIGYNTSSKKFYLTSLTNMGTGILYLEGGGDQNARVVNVAGEIFDPVSKKPIKVRQKISFTDDNNLLIENFDTTTGKQEKKTIEYRFKRK